MQYRCIFPPLSAGTLIAVRAENDGSAWISATNIGIYSEEIIPAEGTLNIW